MRAPLAFSLALILLVAACGGDAPADDSADEAMPEAATQGAMAAGDHPGAVAADPDHYATVYENGAVRILEVAYGPGEASVMHGHPAHCWIFVTGGEWDMATPDGTIEASSAEPRSFGCEEGSSAHMPTNTGTETIHLFLVEMKEGGMAGTDVIEGADAVEVDPAHYAVEYENDAVRILRIRYASGDPTVEHGHPANCIVWLQVDASGEDAPAVGDFSCNDASVHTPGETANPIELMAIELKGRAAAR